MSIPVHPPPSGQEDPINRPSHYTFGPIEVIDAIEAWELGFHLGNVVKYVARAGRKGNKLDDLKKARWYIDREIDRITIGIRPFVDAVAQRKDLR